MYNNRGGGHPSLLLFIWQNPFSFGPAHAPMLRRLDPLTQHRRSLLFALQRGMAIGAFQEASVRMAQQFRCHLFAGIVLQQIGGEEMAQAVYIQIFWQTVLPENLFELEGEGAGHHRVTKQIKSEPYAGWRRVRICCLYGLKNASVAICTTSHFSVGRNSSKFLIVKHVFTDLYGLRKLLAHIRFADLHQVDNGISMLSKETNHTVIVRVNVVENCILAKRLC